jgi:3',5'-cyclic AMP phosphodiesterase CpdA
MAGHPGARSPTAVSTPIATIVAQVSDPHLTVPAPRSVAGLGFKRLLSYLAWQRKRRYLHRPDVLAAVMADLRTGPRDHVIVTGDLTQLGLPDECRQALEWLEAQGDPRDVAVIPGNHDVLIEDDWSATVGLWSRFFASDPDCLWERPPGRDPGGNRDREFAPASRTDRDHQAAPTGSEPHAGFPTLRRRGGVALIGLDSAMPTAPFYATGRLGRAQLERLRGLLETLGRQGAFRLVYVHHSPLPGRHKRRKRLEDAAALLAVLEAAGAELVVHGHGHHEALATLPTAAGPMLVVGAPSGSLVGAAGWNRYTIAPVPEGWSVEIDCRRLRPEGMVSEGGRRHVLARAVTTGTPQG